MWSESPSPASESPLEMSPLELSARSCVTTDIANMAL